jgi:hypothetical protein
LRTGIVDGPENREWMCRSHFIFPFYVWIVTAG